MKRSILLLDDDVYHSRLLAATLNKASYEVHCFRRDVDALGFLREGNSVDVIIYDVQLQGKDTTDFILELYTNQSLENHRDVYKILCTNLTLSQLRATGRETFLRYNEYVSKKYGYTREIYRNIADHFGDKTFPELLRAIEEEEIREQRMHDYMHFPVEDHASKMENLSITISQTGIHEFSIKMNSAVKFPYIQMLFEFLPIVFMEKFKKNKLTKEEKAEWIGIDPQKYYRTKRALEQGDKDIKNMLFTKLNSSSAHHG
ncbi:MAG: response regulator [bacterium]